jgi:hypothetical protein
LNKFEDNRYFKEEEDEAVAFKKRLLGKLLALKRKRIKISVLF